MAAIDKTGDSNFDICWGRGDSAPRGFQMVEEDGVTPRDITGHTYLLTVNTEKDPDPGPPIGVELFQVAGVITSASQGLVEFAPTTVDTDQVPDKYFYDIQETDPSSRIETKFKGVCLIIMDVTK